MKNEQIDFNSYVFKKYYQPKRSGIQREINSNLLKAEHQTIHNNSKSTNSNSNNGIDILRERFDKSAKEQNDDADDFNRKISAEINEEITKTIDERKKIKQEEYRRVLDEQRKEKEKPIDHLSSNQSYTNNIHNNKINVLQSKPDTNAVNPKKEDYIDDFQMIKLEKAKEKQKRLEYSKILQEQIEEQRRYKAESQLKKQISDKEEGIVKPHTAETVNPLIEPNFPSNYTITSCKTPHETQQFISTYANLLSNFCDIKMERYQNTQMLFKPYEKMLNEMVDGKINQLNSPSPPIQDEEHIYQCNQNQNQMKFEGDSIEEDGNNNAQANQLQLSKNNKLQIKKSNTKNSLKKVNQGTLERLQKKATVVKRRILQTSEPRIRNRKETNHSLPKKSKLNTKNGIIKSPKRKFKF